MKFFYSILLLLLTVGCANSPARMSLMSDEELAANFSKIDAPKLCKGYLSFLEFSLDDPTSSLAGIGYRANPLIEKEWVKRGLTKDSCVTPDVLAAIKSKIESRRAIRAAEAAATRITISPAAQPVVKQDTHCTSTRVS